MAYVVIELNLGNYSIADLNDRCHGSEKHVVLNKIVDVLAAASGGNMDGTVQVTTRDSSASVGTSGSGSTQTTYS